MGFRPGTLLAQTAALLLAILACRAFERGLPATGVLCACATLFTATRAMASRDIRRPPARPNGIPPRVDRQQLLALLDLAPTPMVLKDGGYGLVAVNRAARALFGTDEVIAQSAALAAAFDRPDSDRHLLLDGDSYSLALSDMAADGVPMRRLGVLTNITAERRAAEATAMRDLLQVVNHELMNSLTPITSLSQTALDLLPPEGSANIDRVRTALTRVAERSSQLLHFAESYRALAKLPPPRPVPADPRVWLDGAVELTRARWRQVTIATDLEPLPPRLTVDAEQLAQALLNLLANACEAALSGGGPATVAVRVTPLGERCEIAIEDNGPGVPAELEDRIFLPFFTTKAEGSGIGLALARQIVAGHGARLRVDRSATLGGARFSFVL